MFLNPPLAVEPPGLLLNLKKPREGREVDTERGEREREREGEREGEKVKSKKGG